MAARRGTQPPTLTPGGIARLDERRESSIGSPRSAVGPEPLCLKRFSKRSVKSTDLERGFDVVAVGQSNDLGATDSAARNADLCNGRSPGRGPNMSPGSEPTSRSARRRKGHDGAPSHDHECSRRRHWRSLLFAECRAQGAPMRTALGACARLDLEGAARALWNSDRCRREPARRRSDSPVDGVLISHTLCENRTAASALGVVMVGPGRRPRAAVGGPAQLRAGQSLDNMD